jgi:hypothetical protein
MCAQIPAFERAALVVMRVQPISVALRPLALEPFQVAPLLLQPFAALLCRLDLTGHFQTRRHFEQVTRFELEAWRPIGLARFERLRGLVGVDSVVVVVVVVVGQLIALADQDAVVFAVVLTADLAAAISIELGHASVEAKAAKAVFDFERDAGTHAAFELVGYAAQRFIDDLFDLVGHVDPRHHPID